MHMHVHTLSLSLARAHTHTNTHTGELFSLHYLEGNAGKCKHLQTSRQNSDQDNGIACQVFKGYSEETKVHSSFSSPNLFLLDKLSYGLFPETT